MGYPRKADSAPSPWEMLAIFSAKESGMPLDVISQRTGHSVSSIIRWWHTWGEQTRYYEDYLDTSPEGSLPVRFETLFPQSPTQGTFDLGQSSEPQDAPDPQPPGLPGDVDDV